MTAHPMYGNATPTTEHPAEAAASREDAYAWQHPDEPTVRRRLERWLVVELLNGCKPEFAAAELSHEARWYGGTR